MLYHVFASAVLGKLMLTSQWTNSICGDAPNVMYIFDLVSEDARNGTQKEVWPLMYQVQASRMPYGRHCMNALKVPVVDQCCVEHLYPERSRGFVSGSTVSLQPRPLDSAPISANGNLYCQLKGTSNGTVFGYQSILYRANDECVAGDGVICSTSSLKIFSNPNCTGEVQTVLADASRISQSVRFGNFTLEQITVNGGQSRFIWTSLIPISDFTIDYSYAHDVVQVVLYAISILAFVIVLVYQFMIFLKRRTWYVIALLSSQLVWLLFVCVRLYCTVVRFSDIWDGVMFTLLNLASLSSVLISAAFLLKFMNANRWIQVASYAALLTAHIVLTGNNYLRYNRPLFSQFNNASGLDPKILHPIWISFTYAFDCVPPIYVLFSLLRVNTRSVTNRLKMLWLGDSTFCITFILQILNGALYWGIDRIRNNSSWLGSDRAWLSMNGFICCSLAIHALLNYVLIERMAHLVKSGTLFHSSTFSQMARQSDALSTTVSKKEYL
jgi:hypothetical protein